MPVLRRRRIYRKQRLLYGQRGMRCQKRVAQSRSLCNGMPRLRKRRPNFLQDARKLISEKRAQRIEKQTSVDLGWFNYYGLIAVAIIMIPNIVSAATDKGLFENRFDNKVILVLEQIGRFGCMAFMIFNILDTYFDFWFDSALIVRLFNRQRNVACPVSFGLDTLP